MGGVRIVVKWLLLVSIVQAIEVNITNEWQPNLGWEVTCTWETPQNDTLQSVRLYKDNNQFMIFRPEKHGPSYSDKYETFDNAMHISCNATTTRGQKGVCKMLLELYQPRVEDFTYTCEVSGERPWFRIEKKDYFVRMLVPPSKAELSSEIQDQSPSRVMLNCSSTGIPAPRLQWTVLPDTKLEADFTGIYWNTTSKLYQVWSYLSYTRTTEAQVVCTPEVTSVNKVFKGESAEFNSAVRFLDTKVVIATILFLNLLR